jgi:hypothetical protein
LTTNLLLPTPMRCNKDVESVVTAPRLPGRFGQYCKLQKEATAPGLSSAPGSLEPLRLRRRVAIGDYIVIASFRVCHTRDRHGGACDTTSKWSCGRDQRQPTSHGLWLTSSCLPCTTQTGLCPGEALNPMRLARAGQGRWHGLRAACCECLLF